MNRNHKTEWDYPKKLSSFYIILFSPILYLPCYQLMSKMSLRSSIRWLFEYVHSLSCVELFATPWTAALQASLSFTIFWSLLKFMSIESVIPTDYLMLCCPFPLLPSIFPSIKVFSVSKLFIRWPKYWSFSISPSSEYLVLISFRIDWLISLLSKGLSRIFSNTTVQKHWFFGTQPSLCPNSHTDTWLLEKA